MRELDGLDAVELHQVLHQHLLGVSGTAAPWTRSSCARSNCGPAAVGLDGLGAVELPQRLLRQVLLRAGGALNPAVRPR